MRETIDVHQLRQRYDTAVRLLKEDLKLTKNNQRTILNFTYELQAEGIKIVRITKYIYLLRGIAKLLKKDLDKADENDMKHLVVAINASHYSDWSKNDYKVALKRFYRWLRKPPDNRDPPETAWLKIGTSNRHVLPEELLEEAEILKLAQVCENSRDRALILTLAESGCRIAELLTLRRKHVVLDQYGAVLIVSGKTGDRRVRVVAAAPALSEWMKNHPFTNPDSPLWINIGVTNHHEPLLYPSTRKLLQTLTKKAGIRKRVYPQLFRHTRASFLANRLTEAQLESVMGWLPGSKMARVYVHLSGRDTDAPILAIHGLSKDVKAEPALTAIRCPRCEHRNEPSTKFCGKCGMPLSIEATQEIERSKRLAEELYGIPEVREFLLGKLRELQSSLSKELSSVDQLGREPPVPQGQVGEKKNTQGPISP